MWRNASLALAARVPGPHPSARFRARGRRRKAARCCKSQARSSERRAYRSTAPSDRGSRGFPARPMGFRFTCAVTLKQPVANRLAKSGVHGERDHQRGDARRHADHRQQRHQSQAPRAGSAIADTAAPPAIRISFWSFAGVASSRPRSVRHRARDSAASVRSSGNRITSRMACESVSSITSRSMPIPSPAVGGRPWLSARM